MRDVTTIVLNPSHSGRNPHRLGSLDYRRWELLANGMAVGAFVAVHNMTGALANGGLGERWHAVRYLQYMRQRGFLDLPGEVITVRGPRVSAMTIAPLSNDLSQFTFGVEYEVIMPNTMSRATLATHITNAGLRTVELNGVDHSTWSYWTVARDQSLPAYRGAEIKSPILKGHGENGAVGLQQAEAMARQLKKLRCRISTNCGLHVHVGVKNEDANFFRNVLRLYKNNESLINLLVPPSRRYNRFCNGVSLHGVDDSSTKEQILRATGGAYHQKFKKVSTHSYARLGTIEFRQAAGTVDADNMSYWVKFCLRMCLAARAGVAISNANNLEALLTRIGCANDEMIYLLRRAERLNPGHSTIRGTVS